MFYLPVIPNSRHRSVRGKQLPLVGYTSATLQYMLPEFPFLGREPVSFSGNKNLGLCAKLQLPSFKYLDNKSISVCNNTGDSAKLHHLHTFKLIVSNGQPSFPPQEHYDILQEHWCTTKTKVVISIHLEYGVTFLEQYYLTLFSVALRSC